MKFLLLACVFGLSLATSTTPGVTTPVETTNPPANVTATTPAPDDGSSGIALPIIEIVIIGLGLIVLLFVAIRISSVVRRSGRDTTRPQDIDTVDCSVCSSRQGIPRSANVFVCFSCHSANFVEREGNRILRNFSPSPSPSGRKVSLHRVTDTFFRVETGGDTQQDSAAQLEPPGEVPVTDVEKQPVPAQSSDPQAVAEPTMCTVCMDAPADTVMMPCAHGGICFKCADSLVKKYLLRGGAKCIHCRGSIDTLVKLSDMDKDIAQGIEIEIPKASIIIRPNS